MFTKASNKRIFEMCLWTLFALCQQFRVIYKNVILSVSFVYAMIKIHKIALSVNNEQATLLSRHCGFARPVKGWQMSGNFYHSAINTFQRIKNEEY